MIYRVGDRVRLTYQRDTGDKTILEFTITQEGTEPVGAGVDFSMTGTGPWTAEILERAPLSEPTGLGAVVEFEDPLEKIRHRVVRLGTGVWMDEDGHRWDWQVIAANGAILLREGL